MDSITNSEASLTWVEAMKKEKPSWTKGSEHGLWTPCVPRTQNVADSLAISHATMDMRTPSVGEKVDPVFQSPARWLDQPIGKFWTEDRLLLKFKD